MPVSIAVGEGFSLREAARMVGARWRLVVVCVVLVGSAAAALAMVLPRIYRAEVLMLPVAAAGEPSNVSALLGQLGGIVGAGSFGLQSGDSSAEYLALIQSPQFIEEFLAEQGLLIKLFADEWDAASKRWRDEPPSLQDGYRLFTRRILTISQDRDTNIVTLGVEWTDPAEAATWANKLVVTANDRIRTRAMTEAQASIDYLNEELQSSEPIEVRSAIFRLLETQLNSKMLAKGRPEYAFRVISTAQVAQRDHYVRPKPILMILFGVICGGLIASIYILVTHGPGVTARSAAEQEGAPHSRRGA